MNKLELISHLPNIVCFINSGILLPTKSTNYNGNNPQQNSVTTTRPNNKYVKIPQIRKRKQQHTHHRKEMMMLVYGNSNEEKNQKEENLSQDTDEYGHFQAGCSPSMSSSNKQNASNHRSSIQRPITWEIPANIWWGGDPSAPAFQLWKENADRVRSQDDLARLHQWIQSAQTNNDQQQHNKDKVKFGKGGIEPHEGIELESSASDETKKRKSAIESMRNAGFYVIDVKQMNDFEGNHDMSCYI